MLFPILWETARCNIAILQVAAPVIILAFLVVAGSCALMIPVMLYVFQLHNKGWTWQYAALFGSMLASTDAVAIIATMKSSKLLPAMFIPPNQKPSLSTATSNHCSASALTRLLLRLRCTVCRFWYKLSVVCRTMCQSACQLSGIKAMHTVLCSSFSYSSS